MWHEFMRVFGLDDPGSPFYLFWSGIGGDLAYFAWPLVVFRHFNCDVRGCPRIRWKPHPTGKHYCHTHWPAE